MHSMGLRLVEYNQEVLSNISAIKFEKCYVYDIFITLSQQILIDKLLRIVIGGAKK